MYGLVLAVVVDLLLDKQADACVAFRRVALLSDFSEKLLPGAEARWMRSHDTFRGSILLGLVRFQYELLRLLCHNLAWLSAHGLAAPVYVCVCMIK